MNAYRRQLVGVGPLLAAVALLALRGPAQAQSDNAFDPMQAGVEDAAYLGLVLPLQLGLVLNPTSGNAHQDPPGFDESLRRALRWDDFGAARLGSDVLVVSLVAAAALLPMGGEAALNESTLNALLVAAEAMLTTSLLTELAKQITGRQRPNEYYSRDPLEPEFGTFAPDGADFSNESFFSGHTSMAFSAATLVTIYAYEYEWLDSDLRWLIPTTAYAAAFTTGYLRLAGDRHWFSDVLVGAFVGTSAGYLVFAIRTD